MSNALILKEALNNNNRPASIFPVQSIKINPSPPLTVPKTLCCWCPAPSPPQQARTSRVQPTNSLQQFILGIPYQSNVPMKRHFLLLYYKAGAQKPVASFYSQDMEANTVSFHTESCLEN
ncbi:hypothetical protein TNIN_158251 [Trichonephila inaurata madagascariensis]|uniref:Uncharacterized protein n=1 Tax=Trichonephila inaurata madagascariensis TaxID=2747483 RepID=A0A8X7BS98_9ARAC|nr:hypothetical protein TNIN_158251 [Trichonephila inaurata madagascariensis]